MNNYCKFGNFREGFIFVETSHLRSFAKITHSLKGAKSFRRLLMQVNQALVAKFIVANMSFNIIRKNKILTKFTDLQ